MLDLGITTKLAIAAAGVLGIGGFGLFVWRKIQDYFERQRERKQSNDAIKQAHKIAQDMADMPVTPDDAARRLRDRAKNKP